MDTRLDVVKGVTVVDSGLAPYRGLRFVNPAGDWTLVVTCKQWHWWRTLRDHAVLGEPCDYFVINDELNYVWNLSQYWRDIGTLR